MSAFDHTFRAAIPGSSLTHKMGDLPHEKPPKYTNPNEALEYFWKQLNNPEIMKQIWQVARNGGTVWAITRAILYKASLEGIIQFNLGIVLYPIVGKMIGTIIQVRGIDPKVYPKFKNKALDAAIKAKMKEIIMQYDKYGLVSQQQQQPSGSQDNTQQRPDENQAPQQPNSQSAPPDQGQDQSASGIMGMAQPGGQ